MDAWILLSVLASTIAAYYYFLKDANFFKKHGILYITPLPIVGNMGALVLRRKTTADIIQTIYNLNQDAKYVGFFDSANSMLMIRDPELIKSISMKNFNIFPDRNFIDDTTDPLLGKGLAFLRGDNWRDIRGLLNPAFTSSKIKNMFHLMVECATNFTDFLCNLPSDKSIVEMKNCFTRYTNDVLATCVFGISIDSMRNPDNDFYIYGKKVATIDTLQIIRIYLIRSMPRLMKLLGIKLVTKRAAEFFKDLIKTTIEIREKQNIIRPDIMQIMMDCRGKRSSDKGLSIEDMTSQTLFFFFAGMDTVSNLMYFAAHEIAVNPEIQEKLRKEVDTVLKATNGQLTYEAVNTMEYLDAVINETLRMWGAAPFVERKCAHDFELPQALPGNSSKSFVLKKGMTICFPIYGLHHDPKYFDNPNLFYPERFLGENKKDIISGTYLPFGLGPRMCIGNKLASIEIKIVLFYLLARCELKPCDRTKQPLQLSKKCFTISADGGFWLQIIPRNHNNVYMHISDKDEHTYE